MADVDDDADSQDLAEVFDETNTTEDGFDIADPDMAPDVYDVTTAADDDEEDEPEDPGDFDPDQLDEAEREQMLEQDDGVDSPRVLPPDEADLVPAGGDTPEDDTIRDERESAGTPDRKVLDERLDEALEATFPASDPFDVVRAPD
jgi:hypothetical protein